MIFATVHALSPDLEVDIDTYGVAPVSWISADDPTALLASLTVGDRVTVVERTAGGRSVEYVLTGRLIGA